MITRRGLLMIVLVIIADAVGDVFMSRMIVDVLTAVAVVMGMILQMRVTGVLAENQRLDRYRHGVGRQADASEIDVVEIPQRNAVDHQEFACDLHLFAQDSAEGLGNVAVKHDEQRPAGGNRIGEAGRDSFRKC